MPVTEIAATGFSCREAQPFDDSPHRETVMGHGNIEGEGQHGTSPAGRFRRDPDIGQRTRVHILLVGDVLSRPYRLLSRQARADLKLKPPPRSL